MIKNMFQTQKNLQKSQFLSKKFVNLQKFNFSKKYQRGINPEQDENQTIKSDYSIRSKIHAKPVEFTEEDFQNKKNFKNKVTKGKIDYSKKIDDSQIVENEENQEIKPANILFFLILIGGSGFFIKQAFEYVKEQSSQENSENDNTQQNENKQSLSEIINPKEQNLPQNKYKKQFQNLLRERKTEISNQIKKIRIQISQDQNYELGTNLLLKLFEEYEKNTIIEQNSIKQNIANQNNQNLEKNENQPQQISEEDKIINDIKLHPQYRNMHFIIFKQIAQMGFSELQDLENQLKTDPKQENEQTQQQKQQLIEKTLNYVQKYLEADKYDPEIYFVKAGVQKIQGQFEDGIKTLNSAIILNPETMVPLIAKGLYYKESKKYDQALVCFEQVININPQIPQGYINAAYILKLQGKQQEAFEYWEKAAQIDQKYLRLSQIFPKVNKQN